MPVIVEGKYDKITLENVVDALIIPIDGFRIFKDKEKCELLRFFAKKEGIIVLTDSDSAGNMLRAHIKNIVGDGKIFNVYVPRINGKEKRKNSPSKEGILGVEGLARGVIEEALIKSGVTFLKEQPKKTKITKSDLFLLGLSGVPDAAQNRKELLHYIGLPDNLSSNAFFDVINTLFGKEEFERMVEQWQNPEVKN